MATMLGRILMVSCVTGILRAFVLREYLRGCHVEDSSEGLPCEMDSDGLFVRGCTVLRRIHKGCYSIGKGSEG